MGSEGRCEWRGIGKEVKGACGRGEFGRGVVEGMQWIPCLQAGGHWTDWRSVRWRESGERV